MPDDRRPFLFLALLAGAAVPIWVAGSRLDTLPSLRIPVSDLALAFMPMLVALLMTARQGGAMAAMRLCGSAFAVAKIRRNRWLALALALPPALYLAAWGLLQMTGYRSPLEPLDPARLALLFALFVLLAAGEEVGWFGYAFEPLQQRFGALGAALVLSIPWWAGHIPSMVEVGATTTDIAWWGLGAIGLRVIMAYLFNRTGRSLAAIVIFHALLNLSRIALFPATGSHYVTAYQAAADLLFAAAAIVMVMLTRGRLGKRAEPSTAF